MGYLIQIIVAIFLSILSGTFFSVARISGAAIDPGLIYLSLLVFIARPTNNFIFVIFYVLFSSILFFSNFLLLIIPYLLIFFLLTYLLKNKIISRPNIYFAPIFFLIFFAVFYLIKILISGHFSSEIFFYSFVATIISALTSGVIFYLLERIKNYYRPEIKINEIKF